MNWEKKIHKKEQNTIRKWHWLECDEFKKDLKDLKFKKWIRDALRGDGLRVEINALSFKDSYQVVFKELRSIPIGQIIPVFYPSGEEIHYFKFELNYSFYQAQWRFLESYFGKLHAFPTEAYDPYGNELDLTLCKYECLTDVKEYSQKFIQDFYAWRLTA